MDLSKILTVPTFTTALPSTGKEVRFRPYLAKEQKILLMAQASGETRAVYDAISDIIKTCVQDPIDPNGLASFDFEHLWLQIHAKSDGEKITLRFDGIKDAECARCKKPVQVEVDLTQVKVDGIKDDKNIIKLTEDVAIQLRYPKASETIRLSERAASEDEKEIVEGMFDVIALSIDKIFVKDETVDAKSLNKDELLAFVGNLPNEHFDKIVQRLDDAPCLRHVVDLSCPECGRKQEHIIEGLYSFFV